MARPEAREHRRWKPDGEPRAGKIGVGNHTGRPTEGLWRARRTVLDSRKTGGSDEAINITTTAGNGALELCSRGQTKRFRSFTSETSYLSAGRTNSCFDPFRREAMKRDGGFIRSHPLSLIVEKLGTVDHNSPLFQWLLALPFVTSAFAGTVPTDLSGYKAARHCRIFFDPRLCRGTPARRSMCARSRTDNRDQAATRAAALAQAFPEQALPFRQLLRSADPSTKESMSSAFLYRQMAH